MVGYLMRGVADINDVLQDDHVPLSIPCTYEGEGAVVVLPRPTQQ